MYFNVCFRLLLKNNQNKYMRLYCLFLIAFLCSFSTLAQTDWKLKKSEDGIEVYVRNTPGTDLSEFKGITILDCDTETVFNVFRDFGNWTNWSYKLAKIDVLKKESPVEFFVYCEVEMPWPMDNRDMITHIRMTKNKLTGEGRVILESIADYVPENEGKVRLKDGQGFYQLNPTEDGKTEIIYQYSTNPEGIPTWVVNLFITDSPFATLKGMREEVKKAKYVVAP
ncbi:MAG: hypothetical protein ACI85O_000384 [Saprospiraceae bacterium]|jgi:hypothetical protein